MIDLSIDLKRLSRWGKGTNQQQGKGNAKGMRLERLCLQHSKRKARVGCLNQLTETTRATNVQTQERQGGKGKATHAERENNERTKERERGNEGTRELTMLITKASLQEAEVSTHRAAG